MHTADRFQGRDKDVIVLSLVRSNEGCNIGELLKDWRRINVAFTRAKTKLLVVGSRGTLGGCGDGEMLSKFVKLMEEREWIYDLPGDALEAHCFESVVGSTAAMAGTQWTAGNKSPVKKARASPVKTQRGSGGGGKENLRPDKARAPKKTVRAGPEVRMKGMRNMPVSQAVLAELMYDV